MNTRKILLILGIGTLSYGFFNVWGAFYLHSLNDITRGNVDELFIRGLWISILGIVLIIISRLVKKSLKN